ERMRTVIMPIAIKPFAPGSLRERLNELAERRADVFERILPFQIAGDARRQGSPFLTAERKALVKMQRDTLRALLPAKIDKATFEALDLVLSIDGWRRMRTDQGLSARESRSAVRLAVEALTTSLGTS